MPPPPSSRPRKGGGTGTGTNFVPRNENGFTLVRVKNGARRDRE